MNLVSWLYSLARKTNDAKTLSSGDSKKIGKRVKNKAVGRSLLKWLFK